LGRRGHHNLALTIGNTVSGGKKNKNFLAYRDRGSNEGTKYQDELLFKPTWVFIPGRNRHRARRDADVEHNIEELKNSQGGKSSPLGGQVKKKEERKWKGWLSEIQVGIGTPKNTTQRPCVLEREGVRIRSKVSPKKRGQ